VEIEHLAHLCRAAIDQDGPDATVDLKLPKRARGRRCRLLPGGGPLGDVMGEVGVPPAVRTVARFSARAVLEAVSPFLTLREYALSKGLLP
jgi:hypothetical protein